MQISSKSANAFRFPVQEASAFENILPYGPAMENEFAANTKHRLPLGGANAFFDLCDKMAI
jgi:hypothetical protein